MPAQGNTVSSGASKSESGTIASPAVGKSVLVLGKGREATPEAWKRNGPTLVLGRGARRRRRAPPGRGPEGEGAKSDCGTIVSRVVG